MAWRLTGRSVGRALLTAALAVATPVAITMTAAPKAALAQGEVVSVEVFHEALAPFGTFSHETALNLLGLSDIIPSTIHFTIPEPSRLGSRPGIRLHRSRHKADRDRSLRDGLWISTARRALFDSARIGSDPDQLIGAAREAKERAMLTTDDIAKLREHRLFRRADL